VGVEQFLNETNFAAEALTISLAVVGVCTNHDKRMILCFPAAQKLLQSPVPQAMAHSSECSRSTDARKGPCYDIDIHFRHDWYNTQP